MIYQSLNNNNNTEKKNLPNYRNIKTNINDKIIYKGGNKNCINIDNINNNESENKIFYKGGIYDIGKFAKNIKKELERLKSLPIKNDKERQKVNVFLKNTDIVNQFISLLISLKKTNNNADLLFLIDTILDDKREYKDLDGNLNQYKKDFIVEMIKKITDGFYVGSVCFNNISV
tara:strand:- start:752 stop:1273 length:522 start_codon:yes stop_codon:yes gene_type:complete